MQTKISEIGQIAITVSDVKQAMVFYRDVLKLDFLFSPSDELAFFQCGPTRIMLSTPQGAGEIGKNSLIYFKVENIEAFYEAVIQQGAAPEREPQFAAPMPDHELWIGFVRDPDGNLVGIMEEKRSN